MARAKKEKKSKGKKKGQVEAPEETGPVALEIPGVRKAAIAILALGPELSREIFRVLPGPEIERLIDAAEKLQDVSAEEVKATLMELNDAVDHRVVGVSGHSHELADAARDALGPEVLSELIGVKKPTASDRLSNLASKDPQVFARVISREHPQVIAVVMAMIESGPAAEVLAAMPVKLRSSIAYRIANLKAAPATVLEEIVEVVARELRSDAAGPVRVDGTEAAVGLLKAVNAEDEKAIFEELRERDQELADDLESRMFTFEDIKRLRPREIQLIMREVSPEMLALALKAASPKLRETMLNNLSSRAKAMVLDEIDAMGPVSRSRVEAAQKDIVAVVIELDAEQKVNIRPGDLL